MSRPRPALGTPFGADGPWLAAILDVLNDLHDLIDDRLPKADSSGEPVRVEEPAPQSKPPKVVPVQEPAPAVAPEAPADEDPDDTEDEDTTGRPVEVAEPAPAEEKPLPSPPPRAGRGSGLDPWRAFADEVNVPYSPDDGRDDIIAACERARVIEVK